MDFILSMLAKKVADTPDVPQDATAICCAETYSQAKLLSHQGHFKCTAAQEQIGGKLKAENWIACTLLMYWLQLTSSLEIT